MNEQLKTLLGKPLTLEEYFEIFRVDLDGHRVGISYGCLKDEALARAFVTVTGELPYWHPADKEFIRVEKILVLTDGVHMFRIPSAREVKLLPEDETRKNLQTQAREKISPSIRSLLAL